MSATGELLTAAKALLAKGKSVGAAARDKDGTPIDPIHEDAASFSVYGALQRAAYDRRDSTGVDTALVLLGVSDLQDPHMDGVTKSHDDEKLAKRFDDAIARADGGPVQQRSLDAERRMLDPNDPSYADKLNELRNPTGVASASSSVPNSNSAEIDSTLDTTTNRDETTGSEQRGSEQQQS